MLHVIAGRPIPNPPAGVLDHMAFSANNLPATVATLKERGIEYVCVNKTIPERGNCFVTIRAGRALNWISRQRTGARRLGGQGNALTPQTILPHDAAQATLIGRAHMPGNPAGPSPVLIEPDNV